MARMGKIYPGAPLKIKTRKELLETIRPEHQHFLRADTGDMPEGFRTATAGLLPAR
jgi:hypothetical protein